jgi:hypothetical protein
MVRRGSLDAVNKALQELGRRIAAEEGIRPLLPGQRRPDGYYMVNHYTGEPLVPRNSVVDIESEANPTLAAVRRILYGDPSPVQEGHDSTGAP